MREHWTATAATDIRRKDAACNVWEETTVPDCIVKIQRPIVPTDAPAMIYDKARLHTEYRMLGKADLKVMGKDMKVYRHARWTGRRWVLGNRVVSQSW
jgi:hypothetical protein